MDLNDKFRHGATANNLHVLFESDRLIEMDLMTFSVRISKHNKQLKKYTIVLKKQKRSICSSETDSILSDSIFLYIENDSLHPLNSSVHTSYKRFQIITLNLKFWNSRYRCHRRTGRIDYFNSNKNLKLKLPFNVIKNNIAYSNFQDALTFSQKLYFRIKHINFVYLYYSHNTNISFYVSNHTIHTDLRINTADETAKIPFKRFSSRLTNHLNPLISTLNSDAILGNPSRRSSKDSTRCLFIV
ncbi:hypothetical protein AGLY_002537 [Aphis glycines]|uniref:Uncharacterized protein n=1 Tax=Aphis glycines TaxID=307491 RepID=A0A6G0U321_APHGL|nr:hypothetical protein AGLY_002537 [Aphis glycines]